MIKQYKFKLKNHKCDTLRYGWGYKFHGVLMSSLNNNCGVYDMHASENAALSQYVTFTADGLDEWIINLFGNAAIKHFGEYLDSLDKIHIDLPGIDVFLTEKHTQTITSVRALYVQAEKQLTTNKTIMGFLTPTSFKNDGTYALMPTVQWIVNSLVSKWNSLWTTSVIADEDAITALIYGLKMTDYNLQSKYYTVKNVKIPAFIGELTLTTKLPSSLMDICKPLLYFGRYSGVGIKCALGMGGLEVRG